MQGRRVMPGGGCTPGGSSAGPPAAVGAWSDADAWARQHPEDVSLPGDDECSSAGEGACALSALQRRARPGGAGVDRHAIQLAQEKAAEDTASSIPATGVSMLGCRGPYCATVNGFNALFDTNDPAKMQQAMDAYSEWPRPDMGIAVAVTKNHFYEMYHANVRSKLAEYLPQGMFGWVFGDDYEVFQQPSSEDGGKITLLRKGTVTFALGWFRRSMFWNAVVKPTSGWNFPRSTVEDFNDCDKCAAELVYQLQKGGIDGQGDDWKIVGLAVVKMV